MIARTVTVAALMLAAASLPAVAQTRLNADQLAGSLQGIEAAPRGFSAALLRQQALNNIRSHTYQDPRGRPPLSEQLNKLAQITVTIQFDFNSARIRPESYRTVALIADSLYHPTLLGYKFLIVGHADAVGGREANLNLSQRRAEAIREALLNPFGISPDRVEAVGLGEEQLLDSANPTAAKNRRVQVVNIGPLVTR
jgi:outer membrane protein OmpA-like peptidoglycan-associated protein